MRPTQSLSKCGWTVCAVLLSLYCLPARSQDPYFAPYIKPGELPDGAVLPLMHETWTIIGRDLSSSSFAAEVDTIAHNFWPHTDATGIEVGKAAPTYLDNQLVDPMLLEGDEYSLQMLEAYNSIDVHVNVLFDNKAHQPDLGNVARTNHNRLASRSNADGFNVTAWLCSDYYLEQAAVQIEHRMPVTQYKAFLVELAVTGENLVPMTIQKQNVVVAVVADSLANAAVWLIRCLGVRQQSPAPGSANSTAVVSVLVQQTASALFVGTALTLLINESLGPPLFDVKTAAAGLPLSASIYSIVNYPGYSITDQIAERYQAPYARWKIGLAGGGALLGLLLIVGGALLVLTRRNERQLYSLKRDSARSLVDSADSSGNSSSKFFKPVTPHRPSRIHGHSILQPIVYIFRSLWGTQIVETHSARDSDSGSKPEVELGMELEGIQAQKLVHASLIDPDSVEICKVPDGGHWLLGMGSYGMVYKARMGGLDVAVKTINRQHVNPQLTSHQALQVMQQELRVLEALPFDKNVVQFHGSFSQDGNILLVLEFMQGGDLRQALRSPFRTALGWYNKGAQLALDVIRGLHFLHCHGILHRDIKSGNVLLSEGFESAKICDVGLAHIMGNTSLSSSAHNVQTTFAYAAPEMLLCLRCDERADIFSYGVVLWELITREHARRGQLRDFQVPQECPQVVSEMVNACLDQQASNRPSAQQIIQTIESSIVQNSSRTTV